MNIFENPLGVFGGHHVALGFGNFNATEHADAFTVLPDPSGIDWLRIEIQEVLPEDAAALDRRIDDGDGAVDGALRWTAAGDYVTARYLIPFPDC